MIFPECKRTAVSDRRACLIKWSFSMKAILRKCFVAIKIFVVNVKTVWIELMLKWTAICLSNCSWGTSMLKRKRENFIHFCLTFSITVKMSTKLSYFCFSLSLKNTNLILFIRIWNFWKKMFDCVAELETNGKKQS